MWILGRKKMINNIFPEKTMTILPRPRTTEGVARETSDCTTHPIRGFCYIGGQNVTKNQ
jgi:hypothetical protein